MKNPTDTEIEVKFFVRNLSAIQQRLEQLGAELVQERILETNLRFDLPNQSLTRDKRVLRLRKDQQNILTYKGPGLPDQPVMIRQEIEVVVDDFNTTRRILEALGYQVYAMYEKYRCTYRLGSLLITLDELPHGNFIEIEGQDAAGIQACAEQLNLRWSARVTTSYLYLFELLQEIHPDIARKNLCFAELTGIPLDMRELDILPADE